ncbi:MAG: SDR family oxidoreductase [Gammaproteobacteria bacterium AqS3]|nr:SDR family oxidoreductase [Gammaproteobacteria bacterium AqS3]
MKIKDRVAVVTGAGGGIGWALCRRFAREGARAVALADLSGSPDKAAELAGEHPQLQTLGIDLDVSDGSALEAAIERIESEVGPIDLFCSNAGISTRGGVVRTTDEDWERILDINLMAHVYAARALVPKMIERGGGYLLNTASAAGLLSQIGSVGYAVSKHAAVALAEYLSITYGERGLKVSVLCPQAVRTNMTAGTPGGGVAGVDGMMEPEEVAEAVIQGLDDERFLILPHPVVQEYIQRKAGNYDRWLSGMRGLRTRYVETMGLDDEG